MQHNGGSQTSRPTMTSSLSSTPFLSSGTASASAGLNAASSATSLGSFAGSSMGFVPQLSSLPEEVAFELLHLELVTMAVVSDENQKDAGVTLSLSSLELIGFNVGYRLIERLTRETPRFKDELDLMKFICKDFWTGVFRKQIDNLRTNHQGVYVLQDNCFRLLSKASAHAPSAPLLAQVPKFVAFTCGLLRGALSNLGLSSIVTAEATAPPAVKFQIQVQRS